MIEEKDNEYLALKRKQVMDRNEINAHKIEKLTSNSRI